MAGWHQLRLLAASVAVLIALSLSAGCGGKSQDSDKTGGTGGSGSGGAPSGKGGRPGATGGDPAAGGSANGGSMTAGGSAQGGSNGCVYGGRVYRVGDMFPAVDGCNSCSCFAPDDVACTLADCADACSDAESSYVGAIEEAKRCNPELAAPEQCNSLVLSTLTCPCPTFVNPTNREATKRLTDLLAIYSSDSCGENITCDDCTAPHHAVCGGSGRCEDRVTTGNASCLVNGTLFAHGTAGIQDPFSCNGCACVDGSLACTERGCASPCPPDTVARTRCVQCSEPGPGGCVTMETGCVEPCDGSCPGGGNCIDGTCQFVCPPLPI